VSDPDHRLDAFAMLRDPRDYRSCHLAERECSDWSDSLVRHWLYDRAETIRWQALVDSSDDRLGAIATRALREESFHLAHAEQFMSRVSRERPEPIVTSIAAILPVAAGIWDPVAGEADALAERTATASSSELAEQWELAVRADLADWDLDIDWPDDESNRAVTDAQDQRRARSAGFDEFQADLRRVIDVDPAAQW